MGLDLVVRDLFVLFKTSHSSTIFTIAQLQSVIFYFSCSTKIVNSILASVINTGEKQISDSKLHQSEKDFLCKNRYCGEIAHKEHT